MTLKINVNDLSSKYPLLTMSYNLGASVSDLWLDGCGFDPRLLGKLFTPMCLCHQAVYT